MTDSYNQNSINLADGSLSNTPLRYLVGPPLSGAPYNSIQDAIDAAGDRTLQTIANVIVLGGQYNENVSMRRGVTVFGMGGAQIVGSVTFDLSGGAPLPEDNSSVLQNMIVEPSAGRGIIVTGVNFQNVILSNVIVNSVGGAGLEMSNTGVSGGNTSVIICNGAQINASGAPALDQSSGFVFVSDTSFARESNTLTSVSVIGGSHLIIQSRVEGDVLIGPGAGFAGYSYTAFGSDAQPAMVVNAFASIEQCSIQTNASPAVSGTGAIVYTDLTYLGGGRGLDPALAFSFDTGQAYQPFLPGAAAAWGPPAPNTIGDAIDRIVIALSTSVAPGGGIPPF